MKPEELTLTTEPHLAAGGDAVARAGKLVVFVHRGAPSETVRVRMTLWKKQFARAEILEIVEPSTDRREAFCAHFTSCGGCQWQHIAYEAQLRAKEHIVREALARPLGDDFAVTVHGSPEQAYRNRARVHVVRPHKTNLIGFKKSRSKLVHDVDACPVLTPAMNELLAELRASDRVEPGEYELAASDTGADVAPPIPGVRFGAFDVAVEGTDYRASADTFFQGNRFLLGQLRDRVVSGQSGALAADLFCGSGLFALSLAKSFTEVVGVETSHAAVALGNEALERAGLTNVELKATEVEPWLGGLRTRCERGQIAPPDLVLLDPPRTGAKQELAMVAEIGPQRIHYVSCDPATLGRDLAGVVDRYEAESVELFDLFPNTNHVETLVRLHKRS